MTPTHKLRNFSIIAHIDHGKSTLADRFLEWTGAISERERGDQVLDNMELERERGITIKSSPVRLDYHAEDGTTYGLNLIDTPGHVDFSYEVSRSLAACEGALLVVDASQGVEAQTMSNVYLALDHDLEIIPVINKTDLPSADPDRVRAQLEEGIGLDASGAILVSAKEGRGIDEVLEAIVRRVPPPSGGLDDPLAALVFDSWFDPYHGAVSVVRVRSGRLKKRMRIRMVSTGRDYEVTRVGVFRPRPVEVDELAVGEVGFFMAGVKAVDETRIGDTVTESARPTPAPLPGFRPIQPFVFAGLYPSDSAQYEVLREALDKLRMNDSAFNFEPETSVALGFGFRCGFLGLLHMEIVQERLEREYDLTLVTTAPTVAYRVHTVQGDVLTVESPAKLPPVNDVERIEEPYILASIHVPSEFVGAVLALCEEKRGTQRGIRFLSENRAVVEYELPLAEIVLDFYDRLKSASRGYASMEYSVLEVRESKLVKLDLRINGEPVDALSTIIHRDAAYARGRDLALRMKRLIPRQMFEIVIQASIGAKVIARETVRALRKNVTAKCYGGDITRKRKLLERQKEGKKRMKQVGRVEVPQEAFLAVLRVGDE